MNPFVQLLQNPVFLSAGGAWLTAQVSKIIYESIRYGFSTKRLAGGGGMPSSHSATMMGLTTGCLLTHSAASTEFAIALFLSMVVMYDAMGVRRETGEQAKILNRMRAMDIEAGREPLYDKVLDEKMGHTLSEVIVGALLGIAVAVIMCRWVSPAVSAWL